jgi:hypothetical protein
MMPITDDQLAAAKYPLHHAYEHVAIAPWVQEGVDRDFHLRRALRSFREAAHHLGFDLVPLATVAPADYPGQDVLEAAE